MKNDEPNIFDFETKKRMFEEKLASLVKMKKTEDVANNLNDSILYETESRASEMTSGEIEAKIAQAKAESQTALATAMADIRVNHEAMLSAVGVGFSDLRTEIVSLNVRLDHVEKSTQGLRSTMIVTAIGSVIAIVGGLIAVLAYGGQLFTAGLDSNSVAQKAAEEAYRRVIEAAPKN